MFDQLPGVRNGNDHRRTCDALRSHAQQDRGGTGKVT